jgi:hypothetical protein
LGIEVKRNYQNKKLYINQRKYVENILELFRMDKCKPTCTPSQVGVCLLTNMSPKRKQEEEEMEKVPYASVVGSLMYAMVCTRPYIAHASGVVSRYMENPGRDHWTVVKRIFRYLWALMTMLFSIKEMEARSFRCMGLLMLTRQVMWTMQSPTSAYIFTLFEGALSWKSKSKTSPLIEKWCYY